MIYHTMTYLNDHWNDIIQMVEDNYAYEYGEDYVCLLGEYQHKDFSFFREKYNDKKIIIYQLEPLVQTHWTNPDVIIPNLKQADEVWDYDIRNIEKLKQFGINAKYKPLVYAESLKRISNHDNPDIDVLFYGIFTHYRMDLLYAISVSAVVNRYKFVCINQIDGKELDDYIARSKVIVSLNTYGLYDIQKQTRIFYALTNGKKVVSERGSHNYYGDLVEEFDRETFNNTITKILQDNSWYDPSISSRFKEMTSEIQSYETQVNRYKHHKPEQAMRRILNVEHINDLYGNPGTDKDSNHNYIDVYAKYISKYRLSYDTNILEIGSFSGGSALLWNKFFPEAKIVSVDIAENILPQTMDRYSKGHVDFHIMDAYTTQCTEFLSETYDRFDVIIDDGDHSHKNHIIFIDLYYNLLKKGGVMIIEDIHKIEYAKRLKTYAECVSDKCKVTIYDMRHIKNRWDDIMLIIEKEPT